MEANPWWRQIDHGKLPTWDGRPVGIKPDGGGNIRGQGRIGKMRLHQAAHNKNADLIRQLVKEGEDINEVDAAGNTPLHAAAYEDWPEGIKLLIGLGAKVNASNNAGDTPWHNAKYMGWNETMEVLEKHGASKQSGKVLVQEHVPKVKDFYQKDCWNHHPLPYADFVAYKVKEREGWDKERERQRKIANAPSA